MKPRPRNIKPVPIEFILDFYDASLRDDDLLKIAQAMGYKEHSSSLKRKIEQHPELQLAQRIAAKRRKNSNSLGEYVYRSLSPEAQAIWHELKKADGLQAIDAIFRNRPKKLRQQLFIHALVVGGFDLSAAMRRIGIPRSILGQWQQDLEFMQLLEEVQFHKKNFFEHQLIGLVEEKHPHATIFVNRTVNADRGYSEKLELKHSGEINSNQIDLDSLDLDLETRKKILQAIRKKKEESARFQNAKPILELENVA